VEDDDGGFAATSTVMKVDSGVLQLYEPGSLLVFPLVDNVGRTTILSINNLAPSGVWLQGFMLARRPAGAGGDPGVFVKNDFYIHLTAHEPFWWDTRAGYNRMDAEGVLTQIQPFDGREGFCFVWAVRSPLEPLEVKRNDLTGEALLLGGERAYRYAAVPHQVYKIQPDRVLALDGWEYLKAPNQFELEGVAGDLFPGLCAELAVCSLDIDFIRSIQPEFDINLFVWNQNEVGLSRHVHLYQWENYSMTLDLDLGVEALFTAGFNLAATSHRPMWAVFYQCLGPWAWGGNVWQNPYACPPPIRIILPPIPE
jgi:hypothetical protein